VLLMWEDDCVMSQRPAHNAEASSSRAVLPTPDVTIAHPERGRGRTGAPPTHFHQAQTE
jgi:hypothetical protein